MRKRLTSKSRKATIDVAGTKYPGKENHMGLEELEARIRLLEERVTSQEKKLRTLEDIEEIERLQRAYGYYIEHWMAGEIIDLFSDGPDASLTLAAGTYLGKSRIKQYFEHYKNQNNEFMHQVMQLQGIIDVNPDGQTAKGQWYGFGAVAIPVEKGVIQEFFGGIYGVDYVKEGGIWKLKKLRFDQVFSCTPLRGWVKPERVVAAPDGPSASLLKADIPRTFSLRYPSGYIFPFHFKHPVTGKETSERAHNAAIDEQKKTS